MQLQTIVGFTSFKVGLIFVINVLLRYVCAICVGVAIGWTATSVDAKVLPVKVTRALALVQPYYDVDSLNIIVRDTENEWECMNYFFAEDETIVSQDCLDGHRVKFIACLFVHELEHKIAGNFPYVDEPRSYAKQEECMQVIGAAEIDYYRLH